MRILIVEDEPTLGRQLKSTLEQTGYAVDLSTDGEDGHFMGSTEDYDAVILDLGLPEIDGLTVLGMWRREGRRFPVLVLTARDSWSDKVAGLDAGADDYLAKPFQVEELEARIRVQLRRVNDRTAPLVACGDLVFDTNTRLFSLAGETLALTPREHAVLEQLMVKAGRTVSKAALSAAIYDFETDADPSAIEIYVHRVRKKLEGSRVQIATLRGLGYLLRHENQ